MSKVKRWYIGVYGGEAQARGCTPHAREIIRETQGEIFVLDADFERVDVERDALQQRLTAADERLDAGIAFVTRLIECAGNQPSIATGYLRDILAALKPAEGVGDEAVNEG